MFSLKCNSIASADGRSDVGKVLVKNINLYSSQQDDFKFRGQVIKFLSFQSARSLRSLLYPFYILQPEASYTFKRYPRSLLASSCDNQSWFTNCSFISARLIITVCMHQAFLHILHPSSQIIIVSWLSSQIVFMNEKILLYGSTMRSIFYSHK